MADTALAGQLDADRGFAVRTLLARPFLDAEREPDGFAAVVRHRSWLEPWFDETCGWALSVDVPGRFARLSKRSDAPDATRPARRARSSSQPFDRRRYELLCLIAAELASHPVTTIGILAGALAAGGPQRLVTSKHGERLAFVDALQLLRTLGVVRFEGGDVETFVASEQGNAIVHVDSARLHRLVASAVAPSKAEATSTADTILQLVAEPRYGDIDADGTAVGDARIARIRRSIARRVLDDPALHTDELRDDELAYLANPAGRRWIRDRVAEAGLVLEERAEGMVAVDPEHLATDLLFPAPASNVKQVALVLVDVFVRDRFGERRLADADRVEVSARVQRLMDEHPNWGKDYRGEPDGAARLAGEAIALLASLRLVRVDGDRVSPRPSIARYAAVAPADGGGLF